MELKVADYEAPAQISFNFEELKAELTEGVHQYETVVYTDDMIKDAKADRSKLNKVKKALNDERIRREREFMAPFLDFKTKVTELCGIIDTAVGCIDRQIKDYEEKKKLEKEQQIEVLFGEIFKEQPWLRSSNIWNPKWLNASYSMKQIEDDMKNQLEIIGNEIAVLGRLQDYSFEAIACYKDTLSLSAAMQYADDLKAIAEAKAKQQEKPQNDDTEGFMPKPITLPTEEEKPEPARSWLAFKVNVTMEEAMQLAEFMRANGIHFEKI